MSDAFRSDRRTGTAAVAAGLLLSASVTGELIWTVQTPDGAVTDLAGFALFVAAWTAGATALVVALLGLARGRVTGPLPRGARIGRGIALAGAGLLLVFAAASLGSTLGSGGPAEWSFLAFALGVLLLVVAAVPLGLGLRRAGAPPGQWVSVLVSGAAGLVALGASADPWHDLGLIGFFLAWSVSGASLLRAVPAHAGIPEAV